MEGWLNEIFHFLRGFDEPYNLAPSLHVALWAILWFVYMRHTSGWLRWLVGFWFVLIGVSPLLTWQHQVFDVVTGLLLAVVCFFLFPDADSTPCSRISELPKRNLRVAGLYGFGSAAAIGGTIVGWPYSMVLSWPAFSLGAVTMAYCVWGASIFGKKNGRLPLSTWICLGPYLLGADISNRLYRRGTPFDEVTREIYLGRRLTAAEVAKLIPLGIVAVVDATAEYPESDRMRRLNYLNLPMLDLTPPTVAQLQQAAEFIRLHASYGKVYVHCALGRSRSAAIVAAFLLASGDAKSVEEALDLVRRARPQVVLHEKHAAVLRAFRAALPGDHLADNLVQVVPQLKVDRPPQPG